MELKIGEYTIPEGCTIKREGNTVKVYQKKQIDPTILRCRQCKYFFTDNKKPWTSIDKCMARTWGKKYPRHYTVTQSTKACEKFERKEK